MKIQTFSIVVGSSACDAHCKFCVSHTTGFSELTQAKINERNFNKAAKLAAMGGCTTALLTGKGEPTLYPEQITTYLQMLAALEPYDFPFVELQTNAIRLGHIAQYWDRHGNISGLNDEFKRLYAEFCRWGDLGLNTIAISVVDVEKANNDQIYLHHRDIDYPDLAATVRFLRYHGYSIRICLMLHKGMVDDPDDLFRVIDWCRANEVAQFTFRPIRKPAQGAEGSADYIEYIEKYGLDDHDLNAIAQAVAAKGTHILTLMNGAHEAKVYDVMGQNVCVSDCLTVEPTSDDIRTLIFYPDGRLTYDWQYKGARLL
jgi:pyruvate-formate lyase-activating enzyme